MADWEMKEIRELKIGRYVNIDEEPCKIISISTSKPGKHGSAKANIEAASIFTGATLAISMTSFIAIFLYERLGHDMDKTILIVFTSSAIFFVLTYFVKFPVLNIIFIVLAIMSSNAAATMLWSRYCPSLRDTGMVSSVTGFLDFVSYMSASLSSTLFANAVSGIGWGNLILVWCGLVLLGVIVALPYGKIFGREKNI